MSNTRSPLSFALFALLATTAMACTPSSKIDTALDLRDARVMRIEQSHRIWRPDRYVFGDWRAELLSRSVSTTDRVITEGQGPSTKLLDARVKRDGRTRAQGRCSELGQIQPREDRGINFRTLYAFDCDVKVSSGERWKLRITPSSELDDDLVASLRSQDHDLSLDVYRASALVRPASTDAHESSLGYVFYLGDRQVAAIQTKGTPEFRLLRGLDPLLEDALAVTVPLVMHLDEDLDR